MVKIIIVSICRSCISSSSRSSSMATILLLLLLQYFLKVPSFNPWTTKFLEFHKCQSSSNFSLQQWLLRSLSTQRLLMETSVFIQVQLHGRVEVKQLAASKGASKNQSGVIGFDKWLFVTRRILGDNSI